MEFFPYPLLDCVLVKQEPLVFMKSEFFHRLVSRLQPQALTTQNCSYLFQFFLEEQTRVVDAAAPRNLQIRKYPPLRLLRRMVKLSPDQGFEYVLSLVVNGRPLAADGLRTFMEVQPSHPQINLLLERLVSSIDLLCLFISTHKRGERPGGES